MQFTVIVCNFPKLRQPDVVGVRNVVCFPLGMKWIFIVPIAGTDWKMVKRGSMWQHGAEEMGKPAAYRHHGKTTHR